MKKKISVVAVLLGIALAAAAALAQQAPPQQPPTIASVLDQQLAAIENNFVSLAEAMPEEKYSFVPTSGEFKDVRNFASQVKHVAAANFNYYSAILGQKAPEPEENGPEAVKTKEQILKYLRDSFALGHKAIATINAENLIVPLPNVPIRRFNTRLALAGIGCWHTYDHYGQLVEYLRMNGIIPPASRPRPPRAGQ